MGPDFRIDTIRLVTLVADQFCLARPRRDDERQPCDRDEVLAGDLLLHLSTLLERLLVEHSDHVARPLVDDDLFLAELLPGRRHAVPALELRKRDLEDAAEQVAERIPDI